MCKKVGMNLNQEQAAELTAKPKVGQPAMSQVMNGVKKMDGTPAAKSVLVLALKYAFVRGACGAKATVTPEQLGYGGDGDLGQRRGAAAEGTKTPDWEGIVPMLTFGVKLRIEHVGRAEDGDIPRGTTQFPDPTDVDITNVINAVWLQIKRFSTPSMPGAQVQADSPTQRAFLMGEEKWKGTENGGSVLKGRAAAYISSDWHRAKYTALKCTLLENINKAPVPIAETAPVAEAAP